MISVTELSSVVGSKGRYFSLKSYSRTFCPIQQMNNFLTNNPLIHFQFQRNWVHKWTSFGFPLKFFFFFCKFHVANQAETAVDSTGKGIGEKSLI